ncbi:Shedu anti-phage system protein SduA domain-containing protein [Streptomyces massasporeus]|uniref:Shedu anti-phage system protein SduA domain-containing protein n=1 Tax=Streptomyces massasporeus TaxID=67324 RepID=UPI00381B7ED5
MAMVSPSHVIEYLERYIDYYQKEYARFTAPPPKGGGYPRILSSPYIDGGDLDCYLARDGAVILSEADPPHEWFIAGGPAFVVDTEHTQTPPWVLARQKALGLEASTPKGLYRLALPRVPEQVWNGQLGSPEKTISRVVNASQITVYKYPYDWQELIRRLTFGAFELALDLHLPAKGADYWRARRIHNLGFLTADRSNRRFVRYGELLRHVDQAAWEPRSAWARAHVDLRMHFTHAVADAGNGLSAIEIPHEQVPVGRFADRLTALELATSELEKLLRLPDAPESAFHELLVRSPVLLDAYGDVESKPRWRYPPGESPTGKSYVEPDFVIARKNQTYRLVEIERPDHQFATRGPGHPTAAVTHAAFQIGEWKDYINHHYDRLKKTYPNIAGNISTAIVISRSHQKQFGTAGTSRYISVARQQLSVDEILTWDDLLERAKTMVRQLTSLSDSIHVGSD